VSLSKKKLDTRAVVSVVSLCFLWGLAQASIKVAKRGVNPIFQAAVGSITATPLVVLWARLRKLPLHQRDRTFYHGLVIGVLFETEFVFIYLGLSYTTASHVVIFL
jgi:drug/metabolite transporter (DMT)-like permease